MNKTEFNKAEYGRIHSFESFGTVDGPGIRFVIFMQGCCLKCKYCQNRDTWDINASELYHVDEVIKRIEKYRNYLIPSGGGVTVTGGEPLLQAKFLTTLFKKLKTLKIPTAIDTSGMVDLTEDIKELISLTDLFLLDIKHINDEKCKELVGVSNKQELAFAKYLNNINKDIWIRQVIIPGITDNKYDLINLKDFINSLKTVKNIELLKYHTLGKSKWESLKLNYELEDTPNATDKDISKAKEILRYTIILYFLI